MSLSEVTAGWETERAVPYEEPPVAVPLKRPPRKKMNTFKELKELSLFVAFSNNYVFQVINESLTVFT